MSPPEWSSTSSSCGVETLSLAYIFSSCPWSTYYSGFMASFFSIDVLFVLRYSVSVRSVVAVAVAAFLAVVRNKRKEEYGSVETCPLGVIARIVIVARQPGRSLSCFTNE